LLACGAQVSTFVEFTEPCRGITSEVTRELAFHKTVLLDCGGPALGFVGIVA
jgi:hypothetical protein